MNAPRKVNRITAENQYTFLKWFESAIFTSEMSDSDIAEKATEELGFFVTANNVWGAWNTTKKAKPRNKPSDNERISILKRAVERLYTNAALSLPSEWADL